jgi:PAS domain S-box-containing protein
MDAWLHGPADLKASPTARRAMVGDTDVALSTVQFDVLVTLLRHRDRVVTFDELIEAIWGPEGRPEVQFAQVAAYQLDRALRTAGWSFGIEAVQNVGVRLPPAHQVSASVGSVTDQALERASTAMIVIAPDGWIRWANQAAAELTGYPLDELRSIHAINLASPEMRAEIGTVCQSIRTGGHLQAPVAVVYCKDGSLATVGATWKPVGNEAGDSILEMHPIAVPAMVESTG